MNNKKREKREKNDDFAFQEGAHDVFIEYERSEESQQSFTIEGLSFNEIDFKKYERVSLIPEFQKYARDHQWKNRRTFGYAWRSDPFDFIRDLYGPWIEAAAAHDATLMQSDILATDKALWERLQQEIYKNGLPADIELPTESQARLDAIEDPEEQALMKAHREFERRRRARIRANKPNS